MVDNMKAFIKKNFLSLVLSIGTMWCGYELFIVTDSFERFSFYNKIQPYLSSSQIGIILIIVGMMKLIAIISNKFIFKRAAITLLIFVWFFIAVFAIISEPRNMISVYSSMIALFSLGTALKSEGSL